MSNLINGLNRVLNSQYTGAAMFGATSAYKVYDDYKNAPLQDRKDVLSRDLTILGGSAIGLLAFNQGVHSYKNSAFKKAGTGFILSRINTLKSTPFIQKITSSLKPNTKQNIKEVIKGSYRIAKDCAENVGMVGSGILGAIATNYAIQIGHQHKSMIETKNKLDKLSVPKETENNTIDNKELTHFEEFKKKISENQITTDINKIVDAETKRNIMSNITNMPEMRIFTNSMIGLQSFEIMQEKSFKNKLKHTTNNLITGTLIPIFYLSLASNLTRNMKNNVLRIPFVFTSMVAGTMFTNKKIQSHLSKTEA